MGIGRVGVRRGGSVGREGEFPAEGSFGWFDCGGRIRRQWRAKVKGVLTRFCVMAVSVVYVHVLPFYLWGDSPRALVVEWLSQFVVASAGLAVMSSFIFRAAGFSLLGVEGAEKGGDW